MGSGEGESGFQKDLVGAMGEAEEDGDDHIERDMRGHKKT